MREQKPVSQPIGIVPGQSTVTAACLRRLCQIKNSALWGTGTLAAPLRKPPTNC